MILTDEEIVGVAKQYSGDKSNIEFWFARAIEAAVLAKLAKGWVMPEALPAMKWQHHMYTELQLREAFAAGAASQLSAEPVAWMHDQPGRVDVIHSSVKELWLKVGQPSGFYRENVPCKVEHYNAPLYTKVTL